jgi:hypothetical protein
MTPKISKAEKDKVISLLAQYLEGRSEAFQNKVYELVIRYGWDVNDPSFAILLATGQMETILESFPEQFETLFLRLMQESQQKLVEHRQWFEVRNSELKSYIQGLELQQSQAVSQLQENITVFNEGIKEQRTDNKKLVNQIFAIAEQRRAEFVAEAKAQLQPAQKALTQSAYDGAIDLIHKAEILWHKKLIRETVWYGLIAGGVVFSVGFFSGVIVNKGYADNYGDNLWAAQLWNWNQKGYIACVKAKKTTCNFHIVKPN